MDPLDINLTVNMYPKRKWGGGDESWTASREERAHLALSEQMAPAPSRLNQQLFKFSSKEPLKACSL